MVNSNDKGKRGERMFAAFLRKHGFEARRGKQYSGGDDSPDVVHNVVSSFETTVHFEVKFVEALRLNDAIKQAKDDCGNSVPVVAWKKKRGKWMAILPMEDFLDLMG